MIVRIILVISLILMLTGCAASTDPHQGGLFGGIRGLSTGEYDRRIQERQAHLAHLQQVQRELQQQTASLEAEKKRLSKELEGERKRLASLNRDVARLEKKINSLKRREKVSASKLKDLKARVAALKKEIRSLDTDIDALEGSGLGDTDIDLKRKQLEAQRKALEKEYKTLLDLTLQLGQ